MLKVSLNTLTLTPSNLAWWGGIFDGVYCTLIFLCKHRLIGSYIRHYKRCVVKRYDFPLDFLSDLFLLMCFRQKSCELESWFFQHGFKFCRSPISIRVYDENCIMGTVKEIRKRINIKWKVILCEHLVIRLTCATDAIGMFTENGFMWPHLKNNSKCNMYLIWH